MLLLSFVIACHSFYPIFWILYRRYERSL